MATQPYAQLATRSRRDELILSHLGLVRHVLGRLLAHLPPDVDVENLESAGTLGLVEAAGSFDPQRGIEFKTYAYQRIRGAVLDELRRNCPVPQHMLERIARLRKAYDELEPPVTLEDLSRVTGMSHDDLVDCLAATRMTRIVSWDDPDKTLLMRLDDRHESPDAQCEREEAIRCLSQAIERLPDRDRLVVTMYFLEELRLKEIGEVLGLSESRVSRVLNSALFQLGESLRARGVV